MELSLQPHNWIEDLNKYQASIEIYDLIKQNTPEGKVTQHRTILPAQNEKLFGRFIFNQWPEGSHLCQNPDRKNCRNLNDFEYHNRRA